MYACAGRRGPIDIIGQPKDSYYFYQSQWTDQPVLHLFPHWHWPGREGQLIPVLVYTNLRTADITIAVQKGVD